MIDTYTRYKSDDSTSNDFINIKTNEAYYTEEHFYIRVDDLEKNNADGIYIEFLDDIIIKIPIEDIKKQINP